MRWRSLTGNQTSLFLLAVIGLLATLVLGIPPLWNMLFPPRPIAEVRVDDNMGLGQVFLASSMTTNLAFDQRNSMPMEIMFYVRNIGNEDIAKPVYAVLVDPPEICRAVVYPQFGKADLNGCRSSAGTVSMTPDLPPIGGARKNVLAKPPIGATAKAPILSIGTDTDSFRQVIVKLDLPKDLTIFTVRFEVSGQNLSLSVHDVRYGVLR